MSLTKSGHSGGDKHDGLAKHEMQKGSFIMIEFKVKKNITPYDTGLGGTAANHTYRVLSDYLLRDGKPYIMRMGEFHFSRMAEKDWERELCKMKQGGIDIVASYLFWNHHEEQKGIFDFSGRRNIRAFIDLCEKHGLAFFLRIGPWAHGEARHGGFPDWITEECPRPRTCEPKFLTYVKRYFSAIYEQVGSSKNIVGIQVENECHTGMEYMETLTEMLCEIGFHAPLWTATAWGGAFVPKNVLPMSGVYPEAPWKQNTSALKNGDCYAFCEYRESGEIGNDLTTSTEPKQRSAKAIYPYLTCELGGGNQVTYHRRPLIQPDEIAALTVSQLGSGCNGLGYYMYHGGVNPIICHDDGTFVTYQESIASGYPNDCPIISYDFQSPLGECGQIRQSYYELLALLSFVETEGERLAPMMPFFDKNAPKNEDFRPLRVAVRSDGEKGYLFWINSAHGQTLPEKKEKAVITKEDGSSVEIPLDVPSKGYGIIPFGYSVGTETCRWILAMPVCRTAEEIIFVRLPGTEPLACLCDGTVVSLGDRTMLGGMKITVTDIPHPESDIGEKLVCTPVPSVLPFTVFSHIRANRFSPDGVTKTDKPLEDHSVEYLVAVPKSAKYLRIRAVGNLGAAFTEPDNGDFPRLISDAYLSGDDWIVDVGESKTVRLKLQPLSEEDSTHIRFEIPMSRGVICPDVWAMGETFVVETPASITAD